MYNTMNTRAARVSAVSPTGTVSRTRLVSPIGHMPQTERAVQTKCIPQAKRTLQTECAPQTRRTPQARRTLLGCLLTLSLCASLGLLTACGGGGFDIKGTWQREGDSSQSVIFESTTYYFTNGTETSSPINYTLEDYSNLDGHKVLKMMYQESDSLQGPVYFVVIDSNTLEVIELTGELNTQTAQERRDAGRTYTMTRAK